MSTGWPQDQAAPPGSDDEGSWPPEGGGGAANPSARRSADRPGTQPPGDQSHGEPASRGRSAGKPSRRDRRGQAEGRDRDAAGGGDEDYEWIQFLTGGRASAPDSAAPPQRSTRAAPPPAPRGAAPYGGPAGTSDAPAGESRPSRPAHGLLGRRPSGAAPEYDQPYRSPADPRDAQPISRFTPDTSAPPEPRADRSGPATVPGGRPVPDPRTVPGRPTVPGSPTTPGPPGRQTVPGRPMSPRLSRGPAAQVTGCSVADRTGPALSRTSRNSRRARAAARLSARPMPRSPRPPAGSRSQVPAATAGPAAGARAVPIPTSTRLRPGTSARTPAGTSAPPLTRGAPVRPRRTAPGGQFRGCLTRPSPISGEDQRPDLLRAPTPTPIRDVAQAGERRVTPPRVPGGAAAAGGARTPHRRSRSLGPITRPMTSGPAPISAARAPIRQTPDRSLTPGRRVPPQLPARPLRRRGRAEAPMLGHRSRTGGATAARVIGGRRPAPGRPTRRPPMARRGRVRPGAWDLRRVTAARRCRLGLLGWVVVFAGSGRARIGGVDQPGLPAGRPPGLPDPAG